MNCVSPQHHDWRPAARPIAVGSVLMACQHDGCDEIGYILDVE